jgi:hypothetical protein
MRGHDEREDVSPHSRVTICPSFSISSSLLETEGAGKTGRRLAPMVRVQQKSTRQNHRFSRNHSAFPAQWCYGLYVISPVRPGFVVTVALSSRKARHLRRGARTTRFHRPHHAVRLTTQRGHRIPLPTFVTIAKRPSYRVRDAREHRCDLPDGARGICTTGNLRMAGLRAPLSVAFRRMGKGALRRAHHPSTSTAR